MPEFLHFSLLIFLTASISAIDIATHRIPNILTLALFSLLLITPNTVSFREMFTAAFILLFICLFLSIGMGDYKLLLSLLISQGQLLLSSQYLHLFTLVIVLQLFVRLARERNLRGSLPLGPTILLPFLAIYLKI